MRRIGHRLHRSCLDFGPYVGTALGAFCARRVFRLFGALALGRVHALYPVTALSAIAAFAAITAAATVTASTPTPTAAGFAGAFRPMLILRPGFCTRLRVALRPRHARLAWFTRFARFARRAIAALGACFPLWTWLALGTCFAFWTRLALGTRFALRAFAAAAILAR